MKPGGADENTHDCPILKKVLLDNVVPYTDFRFEFYSHLYSTILTCCSLQLKDAVVEFYFSYKMKTNVGKCSSGSYFANKLISSSH